MTAKGLPSPDNSCDSFLWNTSKASKVCLITSKCIFPLEEKHYEHKKACDQSHKCATVVNEGTRICEWKITQSKTYEAIP